MTMASYFGEIIEPFSRALFEESTDSDYQQSSNPQSELSFVWRTSSGACPKFLKFVVVCGKLSLAFAEAYLLDEAKEEVGEIRFSQRLVEAEGVEKVKTLSSPLVLQGDLLIAFLNPSLPTDVAIDLTAVVSDIASRAEEVVVITNQLVNSDQGSLVNAVYCCPSNKYLTSPARPLLPESTILSGLGAGVLSWCEIFSVPAVLYVCYSDSEVLSSVTARPLIGILPSSTPAPNLKRKWTYGGGGNPIGSLSNMYL